jgi:hypothetical protein
LRGDAKNVSTNCSNTNPRSTEEPLARQIACSEVFLPNKKSVNVFRYSLLSHPRTEKSAYTVTVFGSSHAKSPQND